jgi:hypothetical protein
MNTATDAPVFCPAPRHFKVVVKNLKLPAPIQPVVATGTKTTTTTSPKK